MLKGYIYHSDISDGHFGRRRRIVAPPLQLNYGRVTKQVDDALSKLKNGDYTVVVIQHPLEPTLPNNRAIPHSVWRKRVSRLGVQVVPV